MNPKLVALGAMLAVSGLAWAQDIVLKASFANPAGWLHSTVGANLFPPLDVDDDGTSEVFTNRGYLNRSTMQFYPTNHGTPQYPQAYLSTGSIHVAVMRRQGVGEYVYYATVGPGGLIIQDISSGSLFMQCTECGGAIVYDYDFDGLDDVITTDDVNIRVYGIATGNPPISPPQDLDIRQEGNDFVISWSSVPSATAYRVEWSSALDGGVRFTRIGYTTGTTFVHRNQADQERGFYRVMSEDNGTGVVRMVGTSGQGR